MDRLILSYEFDASRYDKSLPPDDFGWLSAHFESERFAGKGGFWVQWQDVVEFGEQLGQYPIKEDDPIVAQWGYNMQEGDELILRIEIRPKNKSGDLTLSVVIADAHDQSQRLHASFRTGYGALDLFSKDLAKLMSGEIKEAVLHGY